MSTFKEILALVPLTDENIAEHNIDLFNLWMLKMPEGDITGPFDTESLKASANENHEMYEQIEAFNLATEKWSPFFKVAQFQRRKPKLVPMHSLQSVDEFYVLVKGVKKGPFTLGEIKGLVEQKKIPMNIQTSIDKGDTWIKLYEHHEFDRRLEKNKAELPFTPDKNVLNQHTNLAQINTEQMKKAQEEQDAMIGLAFIGQGNDKGQKIKSNSKEATESSSHSIETPEPFLKKFNFNFNWKIAGMAFAGVFMFFTVLNSFNTSFKSSESDIKPSYVKRPDIKPEAAPKVERVPASAQPVERKTYEPVKRINRIKSPRKYIPKTARREDTKQVHTDERYDYLDMDDPYVQEELTRDLAGDRNPDSLTPEEIDFIEKADQDNLSDEEIEKAERFEEQRYQEVESFE